MSAIVVELRRDGKLYPVGGFLDPAERGRAINLAHALVCQGHMSYRQARQTMLNSYGVRRSLGQIHKDVCGYACRSCEPDNPAFTGG
jgi:hypothetical protein